MSLSENTRKLLTTIAEYLPRVKQQGYDVGYSQHEKDFWEEYMQEGRSTTGMFSGSGWTEENFKPIRDFNVSQNTFYNHNVSNGNPYDLVEHLKKYNVKITGVVNVRSAFYYAQFTHLPELDISNGGSMLYQTFGGMKALHTIDKLIFNSEGTMTNSSGFQNCQALKNIIIEGVIGRTFSFSECPFTVESMKSIITHLKNYAGTSSEHAYTVTFKSTAFSALAAEGATSPNGNTWAEYIDDLKWNLTLA